VTPLTVDIFVIEDHADTRRALVRLLTSQGYRTQSAADGLEALERLEKLTPRVIILDRMMPVMDGRAVLNHMRKNERLKRIPVIDYTAGSDAYTPDEAAELGVIGRVPKVAGWDKLQSEIKRVIGESQETPQS
jgi:chemosensory pili system protein ChpA (sensor histidine kinase/response regulator)